MPLFPIHAIKQAWIRYIIDETMVFHFNASWGFLLAWSMH